MLTRGDFAYCGLIGSATKRARFEKRLVADGIPRAALPALTCPIGKIGLTSKLPQVMAVAIAAELLLVRQALANARRNAAQDRPCNFDIMPWVEMALRWLHVITGIAWIGASFYFVWLDNHLEKRDGLPPGVAGDLWAVHGGGFYNSRKYLVAPAELPPHLHWFKYEAYWTWISGFLLLCTIYYYGASIYLIDATKAALTPWQAIGIGLAFIAGGWLVYDGLCRSKIGNDPVVFSGLWFAALVASAYGLTHIFSGRGAFIHVGAIIGTAMVANVFFVIIPNQKKAVADMIAGRVPEARLGAEAKQRSLHNNYMTLPVVLIMISNHYPMITSGNASWIVLAALAIAGLLVRHFFNLRHKGRSVWELPALAAAVFIGTMFFAASLDQDEAASGPPVPFAKVRVLVDKHCVQCHAATPTHIHIAKPPAGLDFTRDAVLQSQCLADPLPGGDHKNHAAGQRNPHDAGRTPPSGRLDRARRQAGREMSRLLKPVPLTAEAFAPFGDVIEAIGGEPRDASITARPNVSTIWPTSIVRSRRRPHHRQHLPLHAARLSFSPDR